MFLFMVTTAAVVTAVVGLLGLAGTGAGFLYRRDNNQQDDIDANAKAVNELDTSFARLQTRLFGHPDDRGDQGVLTERGERVEQAEENIDSLADQVDGVQAQAEANGEAISKLEEQVTEHAQQTRDALKGIEDQLDESLVPQDEDFLRGDGGDQGGD